MTIKTEMIQKNFLTSPVKSGIYKLSQKQFDSLTVAASGGQSTCFAVIESLESDSDELKAEADQLLKEMQDLIKMGILTEETERFKETIGHAKINNNGRGFRVMALTPEALVMFSPQKKVCVN
jgi:hypothetical protein